MVKVGVSPQISSKRRRGGRGTRTELRCRFKGPALAPLPPYPPTPYYSIAPAQRIQIIQDIYGHVLQRFHHEVESGMLNSLHDCPKNSRIYMWIYMWRRERAGSPCGSGCIYVAMWDCMRGGGREGEGEGEGRERETALLVKTTRQAP